MGKLRISNAVCGFAFLALVSPLFAAPLQVPDDVAFVRGLEFSNPDRQHLQLDLARPRGGSGPFPAIVCIHGTQDKYVAYEQAVWMVDRLKAGGVEAELLTLPGAGHGFRGADEARAEAAMLVFFDRHLKP